MSLTRVSLVRCTGPAVVSARMDFEQPARAVLPPLVSAYYAAGAGSGRGVADSVAAWSSIRFRPHVLTDLSSLDTATTVLGTPVRTPVLVAPMAQLHAAQPEGERAVARAAAAHGTLLGISSHTVVSFAEIEAAGAPWWFQVYVLRDHELTERLVQRAVQAGARALILTADMVTLLGGDVDPRNWPDGPAKARLGNLTAEELRAAGPDGVRMDPAISTATIGWLRELSGLPVLVKGVVRADDARRCVDGGAAGIVVSTHGGRRMAASITSAEALPHVVGAVGDSAEVYVDSGLRTGEHVAAALSYGARGVFVGRPFAWALAAAGESAVGEVLDGLTEDLRSAMSRLGAPTLDTLSPDLVHRQLAAAPD